MKGVIIYNGSAISTCTMLWAGLFSVVLPEGHLIKFITRHLPKDKFLVIPQSDGNINSLKDHYHDIDFDDIKPFINDNFILGTLAQVEEESGIKYIYLPLDDNFFEHSVSYYFPKNLRIPWKDRKSELCWRGSCTGTGCGNSLRVKFVKMLYKNNPGIRLSNWWSDNKNIPDELFSDRIDYTEFLKYKIFFIVDGACIASNHMWGFATGCVPFMISNAKCWFSEFARPFIDYIPIKHDLSDLLEHIEWVKDNDSLAEQIAENALAFSEKYFSSAFQKEYIINQLFVKI